MTIRAYLPELYAATFLIGCVLLPLAGMGVRWVWRMTVEELRRLK
jgi:hypothetical protein